MIRFDRIELATYRHDTYSIGPLDPMNFKAKEALNPSSVSVETNHKNEMIFSLISIHAMNNISSQILKT